MRHYFLPGDRVRLRKHNGVEGTIFRKRTGTSLYDVAIEQWNRLAYCVYEDEMELVKRSEEIKDCERFY